MEDFSRTFVGSLVGEKVERWTVERVLKAGGMGVVAVGRDAKGGEVAIKFMLPELALNAVASARFLREARLAAQVRSRHFVRIVAYGKLELLGVPYLVMELLRGGDLSDELAAFGAHPADSAVDYVLQAAAGLAELHALGAVHRDLKPSNLFLAEEGGARTIKVLDLGVSKEGGAAGTGTPLTETGTYVGTPHYMSPEQIRDAKGADVRTDVWALGVILFELLTGGPPFGSGYEGDAEVYGLILHTAPAPLRSRKPNLPEGLEAVIAKCLARERDDRYASVAELAEALRPYAPTAARDHAVRATSPSPPLPGRRAIVAVSVAAIAAAVLAWMALRPRAPSHPPLP